MSAERRTSTIDLGREALFAGGFIGVLWFAAYLYELGFLARFGVPPTLADVGFPKVLTVAFVVAPAAAFAASFGLLLAGYVHGDLRTLFLAVAAACALAIVGYGLGLDGWPGPMLLASKPDLMPPWLQLLLGVCVIVVAGHLGAGWFARMRTGDSVGVCLVALLTILAMLVPIGFGWLGAARKAEGKRTFLYLADDPGYVLVRIYDDRAVFVRYDRQKGIFDRDYRIKTFGSDREAMVSFRPSGGAAATGSPR